MKLSVYLENVVSTICKLQLDCYSSVKNDNSCGFPEQELSLSAFTGIKLVTPIVADMASMANVTTKTDTLVCFITRPASFCTLNALWNLVHQARIYKQIHFLAFLYTP